MTFQETPASMCLLKYLSTASRTSQHNKLPIRPFHLSVRLSENRSVRLTCCNCLCLSIKIFVHLPVHHFPLGWLINMKNETRKYLKIKMYFNIETLFSLMALYFLKEMEKIPICSIVFFLYYIDLHFINKIPP